METFVWDQNFVTGLAQVDDQHYELVELFNELNESLFSADLNQGALLQRTYERVIEYARNHFHDEEQVMVEAGVDPQHVLAHRRLHEQFVEQAEAMWSQRSALIDHPENIVNFLTSWLGLHILGVDQSMARQIRLIGEGMSPAAAYEQESSTQEASTKALVQMVGKLYQVLSLQNTELAKANTHLEQRVQQRTAELAHINAELLEANAQLERFSQTDGLLQIANRGYFERRLIEACAYAARQGKALGLLMIDVDFFKRYNDHYGHQAGDACLKAVARAVGHALHRGSDLLARYGGEELVVLLPDTDAAGTLHVAQRIVAGIAAVALPHARSEAAAHVTVSVGGTSRIPSPNGGAVLIGEADAALYQAKESGRNRALIAMETESPTA